MITLLVVLMALVQLISAREYKWRDLSATELTSWYTPTDLCVLNSSNKLSFPQETRKNDCFEFSRGNRRMHCGVGMGNNNHACFGPFAEGRPHFKMGVEGFTNASSTPLLDAFTHFADTNTTLILLGDSTTRQKLQALDCELRRENPRIRTNGNVWGILPCNTKYIIYLPDQRSVYLRVISMGPNSAACLKGGLGKFAKAKGAYENAAYIVDIENNVFNRSVFLVANMGLWYNDESEYQSAMPSVLDWLQQVATLSYPSNIDMNSELINPETIEDIDTSAILLNNYQNMGGAFVPPIQNTSEHGKRHGLRNFVAWHESFTQHWVNPWGTGYFAKPYLEEQMEGWKIYNGNYSSIPTAEYITPFSCRKVTNTSFMADWRNDIVTNLFKQDSTTKLKKNIVIFPMADITRPLVDMHTTNPAIFQDCTHYCFSPLLFQPLWHQILEYATTGTLK